MTNETQWSSQDRPSTDGPLVAPSPINQSLTEPVISIAGSIVALGPLRRDLVNQYDRWLNDPEVVIPYFRGALDPAALENTQERYNQLRQGVEFTIYEFATMRPIGICGLKEIDHYNRTARFGIFIGEKDLWGRGYGTETTVLTLDWAFNAMGLHTVLLTVFAYNQRGIGAYKRAGFHEVGRWREAKRLAGQAYDIVFMDCLATEFEGSVLGRLLPNA